MPKPQPKAAIGDIPVIGAPIPPWSRSHGMMIAGRAYADEADLTASQMADKWGVDRLRMLVDPELRTKFDRQRYLFNQAIWHGDLEAVRRESGRMVKGWERLDQVATAMGAAKLEPDVWEVALADGSVAVIVRDNLQAEAIGDDGRKKAVYTLDEIARLLAGFPALATAKMLWPGAEVTKAGRNVLDPLLSIPDTQDDLDGEIPF